MEFYSSMKKNEILLFTGIWIELEIIILSEDSQVQKDNVCMFSLIYGREIQYKYKHYHIYTYIYRTYFQSGTVRGKRKRRKE
jgi:hypothetical protein